MVFLFNRHLKLSEMISNDTYTKAVQDVLEFIDSVEDGDLDYIIWKLKKFVEYGEDFNKGKSMKNTVTPEQVKENMQDVIVRTLDDFGKPCTYVTVRMKNGFTLRESTTCVDPANYNEEIGKEICLRKIEDKVWFLLGYQLQEDLFRSGELVL